MLRNLGPVTLLTTVCLLAPSVPAAAANLLTNPGFDTDLDGWSHPASVPDFPIEWSPEDVDDSAVSGSLRLSDGVAGEHSNVLGAMQCVPAVAGQSHDFGAWVHVAPGQDRTGQAAVELGWYGTSDCTGPRLGRLIEFTTGAAPGWHLLGRVDQVAPGGTLSARIDLLAGAFGPTGTYTAHFDEAHLCTGGDCTATEPPGPEEPPYATWIRAPGLPGFEAQVRITPAGQAPFEGSEEAACIPEAICARGALPGRPEIFAKVIGPRPNGHLWVQLIRFTPSQVEVWLRQVSTLEVRYYVLPGVAPGAGVLSGIEDRGAFSP